MGCWLGLRALKTLYFYKVIEKLKNKLKGFLQRILQEIMKKNNTWNIRRMVDEMIVPLTHRPSIIKDCQILYLSMVRDKRQT